MMILNCKINDTIYIKNGCHKKLQFITPNSLLAETMYWMIQKLIYTICMQGIMTLGLNDITI